MNFRQVTVSGRKLFELRPGWYAREWSHKGGATHWRVYVGSMPYGATHPTTLTVWRDADGVPPRFDSLHEAAAAVGGGR